MARYVLNNKRYTNRVVEALVTEHMERFRAGTGDTETGIEVRDNGIYEASGRLVQEREDADDFEITLDFDGNARGYLTEESGQTSVVDVRAVGGHPVDGNGNWYEFTGEVRYFGGWPEANAAVVNHRLSIALR